MQLKDWVILSRHTDMPPAVTCHHGFSSNMLILPCRHIAHEASTCILFMSDLPAADLKQALAEHKGVIEEGQATALSAQQQLQEAHSLVDQLSTALEAKDTMLASAKVLRYVLSDVMSHALM